MKTIKNLGFDATFLLILVSCRDTKNEEPQVEIKTEKTVPNIKENTETEDIEKDYKEEENEIEGFDEETDTLSIEE